MSRIQAIFRALADREQKALIPYITAGDPDLDTTEELIVEMAARGADIIELGVPFSDPMADGPVIQRASERALARGITLKKIIEMVERSRRRTEVPIILFSYYNPLLQFGLDALGSAASRAGIDGVLATDLVPEESEDLIRITHEREMDMIFLLAPTSSDERIAKVARLASGFIYAVSRTGITGVQQKISEAIEPLIKRIKKATELPIAVGFGISNAEHVREVWRYAEGAVVGSRIVSEIENCRERDKLVSRVGELISELRGAADAARR